MATQEELVLNPPTPMGPSKCEKGWQRAIDGKYIPGQNDCYHRCAMVRLLKMNSMNTVAQEEVIRTNLLSMHVLEERRRQDLGMEVAL